MTSPRRNLLSTTYGRARLVSELLEGWHYDWEGREAGDPHPHKGFSDSLALTHCICFGAGFRILDALRDAGYTITPPPPPGTIQINLQPDPSDAGFSAGFSAGFEEGRRHGR